MVKGHVAGFDEPLQSTPNRTVDFDGPVQSTSIFEAIISLRVGTPRRNRL